MPLHRANQTLPAVLWPRALRSSHVPAIGRGVLDGFAQERRLVHELLRNAPDVDAGPAQAPGRACGRRLDEVAHCNLLAERSRRLGACETTRPATDHHEVVMVSGTASLALRELALRELALRHLALCYLALFGLTLILGRRRVRRRCREDEHPPPSHQGVAAPQGWRAPARRARRAASQHSAWGGKQRTRYRVFQIIR